MPASMLPASHADLLKRPVFAHLATVRPDGAPQSSVMWFEWDGELLRFTHTTGRQKFRNFQHESRVALSIADPEDPYRFLEVRGVVDSIIPDTDAAFCRHLQQRYGLEFPIHDADQRVVVAVRPHAFVPGESGGVIK